MVRKTTIFWLLHMVSKRSDLAPVGLGSEAPQYEKAAVRFDSFRFKVNPVPCIPVHPIRSAHSVRRGSVLAFLVVAPVPVLAVPARFVAIL